MNKVCKKCGCTENNACVHKDGKACYWVNNTLCSKCREFTFTTFKSKKEKKVYTKTEDELNKQEQDLLYGDLLVAWENNTRFNRNKFIQELIKTMQT